MQKILNEWNVALYGIQYSASLLYMGFEYGTDTKTGYFGGNVIFFIFPAMYLILLFRGIHLVYNWEHTTSKSYYPMAIIPLAFISVLWGLGLRTYFLENKTRAVESLVDVVYLTVMFALSVWIAINYIVCAVKTKKENSKYEKYTGFC